MAHNRPPLFLTDKRQEKTRLEAAEASGTGSNVPTRHPTEEMDVDGGGSAAPEGGSGGDGDKDGSGKDKDGAGGADGGKDSANHPPAKRYRMTDQMKALVWELVLLSNECCRLENEKK